MNVKFEITNFTSPHISFDQIKFDNEMSHEEFIALIQFYSEVFTNMFTEKES